MDNDFIEQLHIWVVCIGLLLSVVSELLEQDSWALIYPHNTFVNSQHYVSDHSLFTPAQTSILSEAVTAMEIGSGCWRDMTSWC